SIAAQIGGTIARLKAEEELREYRDHLEDLVRERTMDLTTANEALGEEILERNRTEKALKESETHYRLLADNVTDVIWVRDMHLKPTYVSPSVRDLLGYSVEEAMSQTIEEIVCPSSLETVTRTLAEALVKETTRKRQTLKSRTIEAELKRKNGSTIWAEITTSFLRNEKGQPIGIIGVTHDITERKQAEEALRQSERKLRTIFENVNDEIVYVDETGKVIEVNKRLKDIFGYEPHEVIGKGFMDFPFLDPGDMKQIVDAFTALTDGSGSSLTSFKATRKDGSMVFVESSSRLVELGDGAKCHLVIIRDITERKLAEEALRKSESLYRLLADNVTDVIWAMDLHLNFTYVSPSVTAMQGYTVDEMATKDLQEILTPDSFELVTGILAEELATESTEGKDLSRSRTLELEIQCKDGSSIWAEVKMSFIRDQNGQPVSIIGVTRDITERKRAQDALRESEEKFRSLAESAPNVILTVTADGTILFINRTVEGITREEAISKTVYDFVKPAYHSTMRRAMEQVIRTGQPTIYEVIGLGPEGRESWYETHVGPIKRDGHVVALIFINTDITERVRQQEQILQHNKELAALNAIAQTVSQSLDLNEILNNALDKIGEILSIKNTLVALMDENGGLLTIRVERGMNRARIPQWRIGEGVLGHVAQIGEPMFIDSIPDASGLMREDHVKAATSYHVRSIMYVPLKAKGRTLGVLMAATQADRVLAPEERNLLITIGHQVSTAIENAMLYRELQQKEEMRRDGLRQAILAQEEERRRIARELHDQTSQVLTGASAMIEASVAALPQEYAEVKERLQLARLSLTHMLIDVRNIIYELRPTMLDDLGLVAAARWHAEGFLGKASIRAHFQTKGRKRKLPAPVETAIFRIIQEAATNIVRHAKARSAEIQLEYRKHSLGLSIKDDGKGFAIERIMHPKQGKRGLGLLSMKERVEILGGCFVIESHPDTGTLITIEIPT
ncbi:MAG: PAS domain S-box protein, partial [Chloroflexi bacterium]|nr:PAS domain S-box protein [Chloroflexota bacterium]